MDICDVLLTGLREHISEGDTVLDLGAGKKTYSIHFGATTVDAWEKTNPDYLIDLEKDTLPFEDNSFDHILMIDFIEHLDKEAGSRLLDKCKRIARKKIFVFTPLVFNDNGKNVADPHCWSFGNPFNYHKSLWSVGDFCGWKSMRTTPEDYFGYWEKKPVSVVMTSYKRAPLLRRTLGSIVRQFPSGETMPEIIVVEDGDDGGETKSICKTYGVDYMQRKNRPDLIWSNPSIPANIGLRKASGDVIIFQSAEVMHVGNLVKELSNRVDGNNAVLPSVMALDVDGRDEQWYVHGIYKRRPYFFCGAMKAKWFKELRGLDEDFKLGGYEDDDFASRLTHSGVRIEYADDLLALHQWHTHGLGMVHSDAPLFKEKLEKMTTGEIGPVRNLDHEWGKEN